MLAGKVKKHGSTVRQFCKVESVRKNQDGYEVQTSSGVVQCDVIVNAAGAWAPKVAELLEQQLHLRPERHEAVTILLDEPLDYTMPMVM
ncbi:FAD-dependent oxidoreductase, partial [Escherichia coli]|uniref:FAD-dependent oxidoreductase n=1 Tax=Escherichia coli TaxID=562 RepID=UPI00207C9455